MDYVVITLTVIISLVVISGIRLCIAINNACNIDDI